MFWSPVRPAATTIMPSNRRQRIRPRAGRGFGLSGRAVAVSRRAVRAASRPANCRRTAFVGFLQNHDQVGNTPFGTRIAARAKRPRCTPRSRSCCCRRKSRCCSWARNGRAESPFSSSAISARAARRGARRDAAASSRIFPSSTSPRRASTSPTRPPYVDLRCFAARLVEAPRARSRPLGLRGIAMLRRSGDARSCRGLAASRRAGAASCALAATAAGAWRLGDGARLAAARQFRRRARRAAARPSSAGPAALRSGGRAPADSLPPSSRRRSCCARCAGHEPARRTRALSPG